MFTSLSHWTELNFPPKLLETRKRSPHLHRWHILALHWDSKYSLFWNNSRLYFGSLREAPCQARGTGFCVYTASLVWWAARNNTLLLQKVVLSTSGSGGKMSANVYQMCLWVRKERKGWVVPHNICRGTSFINSVCTYFPCRSCDS